MPERVVITGYGAVTPLGNSVEDTWQSLISGVCGIGYISLFDVSGYDVQIGAEVKNFNPVDFIEPVTARYTDRFAQFALAASMQAVQKSRLKINDSNRYDTGVIIGTGVGGVNTLSTQIGVINAKGPKRASPFTVPMMIADAASGQVSIKLGIMGPNFSLTSACATGADAIGMAYRLIKHGELSTVIAGGTDAAISPIGLAGFTQAGA